MKETPQLTIQPHTRPQVLLLGNGMNRVYGGASWAGLLQKINRTPFTPEEVKTIPLPMQAVLLSEDHVDESPAGADPVRASPLAEQSAEKAAVHAL